MQRPKKGSEKEDYNLINMNVHVALFKIAFASVL